MRLFVAADLPDEVPAAIAAEQKRIGSALAGSAGALKWVRPEHSHLTLVFVGEVADARVPSVVDVVGRKIEQPAFEVTLETFGVFPPRGAPRVFWIGIGAGSTNLGELQREIDGRISSVGLALERRPFHPHLTLARWRDSRPADRARALRAASRGVVARARVTGATLYQSRLSSGGPTYTALAHARLNEPSRR